MTQQKQGIALPKRRGVTLIEIAIVLVIIGILLGGVLKGQELINNARVRAMADQHNAIKVGWFAFLDRFGGMPADYPFASQYVRDAVNGSADGIITQGESRQAFQQLASAGYLRCRQCNDNSVGTPSVENSLLNAYGGIMGIFHNGQQNVNTTTAGSAVTNSYANDKGSQTQQNRLMIHAGNLIPSNIVAEVDLKIDDGIANQGEVVFNNWNINGTTPPLGDCMSSVRNAQTDATNLWGANAGDSLYWRNAVVNPVPNCGLSNNL